MKRFLSGLLAGIILATTLGAIAAVTYIAEPAAFKVLVNGKEFVSDPPALVVEGKTYLPLRAMGDALGVPVNWNEELRQAEVGTTPQSTPQTPAATLGEANALQKAISYLELTAFSYEGLIKQLEFEKFSTAEATYAADNCGANWNEQAAKKAKSYLELTAFSRDSLISQLEFEGFTHEQAVYGAMAVGY